MNEQYEIPLEPIPQGVIPKHVLKGEGVECENCGKYAKATARKIDSTMARGLILMAGERGRREPGGWVSFPELPKIFLRSKTLSQAKHWRLIEARVKTDMLISGSGWWRLTPDGMRFVAAQATITETAWVYNDRVLEYEGPQVSIWDCLGHKFNYETLLNESGYRGH